MGKVFRRMVQNGFFCIGKERDFAKKEKKEMQISSSLFLDGMLDSRYTAEEARKQAAALESVKEGKHEWLGLIG